MRIAQYKTTAGLGCVTVSVCYPSEDCGDQQITYNIKHGEQELSFWGSQLELLRDALREAESAIPNLQRTLSAAEATNVDQHRDALTDGAEQQIPEPEPLLETVCGDPFVDPRLHTELAVGKADLVSADDVKLLRKLSEGETLEMSNPNLHRFLYRGWVVYRGKRGILAPEKWLYEITDKGRRALDAQEPEAESEEEVPLEPDELAILRKLVAGRHIFDDHKLWHSLYAKGLLSALGNHYYTITDQGRAVLAEQAG